MEYEITLKYARKPKSEGSILSSSFPQPAFPQDAFMYVLTANHEMLGTHQTRQNFNSVSVLYRALDFPCDFYLDEQG